MRQEGTIRFATTKYIRGLYLRGLDTHTQCHFVQNAGLTVASLEGG